MNDRSWMLNPNAIRTAKECIQLVKQELGVKLLLSHPDFIEMLHSYVELTENEDLSLAYSRLISHAGAGTIIKSLSENKAKVVMLKQVGAPEGVPEDESVNCGGKAFPRWKDGKEFSGLYRGQPNYT